MNIRQRIQELSDKKINVILYFSALIYGLVFALLLNVPPVLDEVGTLANTAYLCGYDWSQTVFAQGGSYFKPGYALLYWPFMKLVSDPYILYKCILAVNVFINSFIPVICFKITGHHLGLKKVSSFLISSITFVFPATFLYTMYAKADSVLLVIPWLLILLALELYGIDPGDASKRTERVILSCLFAFTAEYAYFSHTRGIVLVIASVLTIILTALILKRSLVDPVYFSAALLIGFLTDKIVSDQLYNSVFAEYGTMYSSIESYDFAALFNLFSLQGIKAFAKEFIGTVYNILVSTFGLAGITVISGFFALIRAIRNRNRENDRFTAAMIITVLMILGTVAMSCLYFFPYVYDYLYESDAHRADWLVYGRYSAGIMGPAAIFGIIFLYEKRYLAKTWEMISSLALFFLCGIAFVFYVIPNIEGISAVSRNFIQLCPFLKLEKYGSTSAVFEHPGTDLMILYGLVGVLFTVMIYFAVFKQENAERLTTVFICILLCSSVAIGIADYFNIRYSRDQVLYTTTKEPVEMLRELSESSSTYPVLVDTSAKNIKHYQFLCREYVIGDRTTLNVLADDIFIIAKKGYFVQDFYEDTYYTIDAFDYDNASNDIVYVKGDKLAGHLINEGFTVTKYEGKLKKSPVITSGI